MRLLPNALTVSRVFIAAGVTLLALNGHWSWAFGLVLIGLATDWFDGYLATRLGAKSRIGSDVLEPLCDFIFAIGLVAGLVLTDNFSWWAVAILAIIQIAFQLTMWVGSPSSWWYRLVLTMFIPFYVTTVVGLSFVYALVAFGNQAWWLLLLSIPLGLYAASCKSHRFGWQV
jgi:phosphatidylglycerophosphate synthase